jgi:hypothetical protein
MLFSAIAILLAALTLGSLAEFASPDAQAVTNKREPLVSQLVANGGERQVSQDAACASTAEAPAARTGAGQQG